MLAVRYGHPDWGKLQICGCRALSGAQRQQERAQRSLDTLLVELGGELAHATLDNYDLGRAENAEARASMAKALDICRAYRDAPHGWIYLYGPTGVGKSHLLAATVRALAEGGDTVAYASEPELMRYLRAGWKRRQEAGLDDDPTTTDERIVHLQNVGVLAIDDIGTEHRGKSDQSWCDSQLFSILHPRYQFERPTLLSSNLRLADIESRLRSRIDGRTKPEYAGQDQLLLVKNADQRGRGRGRP
jgi:DNA replication protein DnaC